MTASSRGSKAFSSILRSSRRRPSPICSECTFFFSRRSYAVAAAALKPADSSSNRELPTAHAVSPIPHSLYGDYSIRAGVLLTRAPILTPTLTSFEKAFFYYQKRLQERLALPFTRYFYFKKNTPADTDYKLKAKDRNFSPARELGGYTAYGDDGWNDELLVKEAEKGVTEPGYLKAQLVREGRATVNEDGVAISKEMQEEQVTEESKAVMWRITEADRMKDYKRLDRRLDKTLYLLVKREGGGKGGKKDGGGWGFPSAEVVGKENLHQAAERILVQTAGENMNTWIVGHVPVGHHIRKAYRSEETKALERKGEKTFFMKGRIMAGQANLEENLFGLTDFKWLTKEEVERHVSDKYFSQVKNMMADR